MFDRRERKAVVGDGVSTAVVDVPESQRIREGYKYPAGMLVRIADRGKLETFAASWHWHHPLLPEQLEYAQKVARVEQAGLYHGGDELYELEGVPGYWHPECLEPLR